MKSNWSNFLAGFFSIFQIAPASYPKRSQSWPRSDWEAVGRDMRRVIKKGTEE